MKKYVIISLFVVVAANSFSQEYTPMLGQTNEWYVLHEMERISTTNYQATHDEFINGKQYKALTNIQGGNTHGYIREDIENRIVYILPNSIHDTVEIIMFDFSLNEGDSISLYSFNYDSLGYFYVDSVGFTATYEGNRKTLFLSHRTFYEKPVWVEGIGTKGNIQFPTGSKEFGSGELSCFFRDGVKVYQSEFSKEFDDCSIYVGLDFTDNLESTSMIYPNPATTAIHLRFERDTKSKIRLYNVHGKVVLSTENQNTINIRNLDDGLYFVTILIGKKLFAEKLLVR